jgi:uncharacterized membrane protein
MRAFKSDVNLWRIPLLLSLAGVVLFGLTMIPDVLDALGVIHLPSWFTMGSIDDARAILGAMLGSVSTVLALIFSVALLVLSMVATLFGPRLLYRFLEDWVTQFTIGLFMATFIYLCLVFLVTHQDANSTFIPQVSLITSWCLVIISFGFLVYYSHRIAVSVQNPDLVARISDDLHAALVSYRGEANGASSAAADPALVQRQLAEGANVVSSLSGYVQSVEPHALVAAARRAGAVIHLLFRPGQYVLRGEPFACVWPAARGADLEGAIERDVALGRHRVLKQDVEFGIAQIVEIAIRALSPAINDSFTGIACVDFMGDALLAVAQAPPFDGCWHDTAGTVRLRVPPLRLERLVKMAFDQIRQAAADNPAVLIRMLQLIGRIAPRIQQQAPRKALMEQADAIRESAVARNLVQIDRDDIEAAWRRATRDSNCPVALGPEAQFPAAATAARC